MSQCNVFPPVSGVAGRAYSAEIPRWPRVGTAPCGRRITGKDRDKYLEDQEKVLKRRGEKTPFPSFCKLAHRRSLSVNKVVAAEAQEDPKHTCVRWPVACEKNISGVQLKKPPTFKMGKPAKKGRELMFAVRFY